MPLPVVLGYQGAGASEAAGPGVPASRVGERVALTFSPAYDRCRFCLEGRAHLYLDVAGGLDTGFLRACTPRLHAAALAGCDARAPPRRRLLVPTHAVVLANGALTIGPRLDPGASAAASRPACFGDAAGERAARRRRRDPRLRRRRERPAGG